MHWHSRPSLDATAVSAELALSIHYLPWTALGIIKKEGKSFSLEKSVCMLLKRQFHYFLLVMPMTHNPWRETVKKNKYPSSPIKPKYKLCSLKGLLFRANEAFQFQLALAQAPAGVSPVPAHQNRPRSFYISQGPGCTPDTRY